MTGDDPRHPEERVLLLAPTAKDAALSKGILTRAGLLCAVCPDLETLCRELEAGGGTAVITEDAIDADGAERLMRLLERQPAWSDLPLVVMTSRGAESAEAQRLETLGNVTLLELPVRVGTLVSVIQSALRARRRQYQVRDHLAARQESEAALRRSEEQLRQLADAMPQIVWTAGSDGGVDYYNRRWYEFTGFADGAGSEEGWTSIIHPDDVQRASETWSRCVQSGEPYEIDCRFLDRRTGEYRWHLCRALPVRDAAGKITRWFGTCTDIHDQRQALEALAEVDRRKDEFLAMLAHELRNPLAPVLNAAHVLRVGRPEDVFVQRHSETIERQSRHLAGPGR